MMNQGSPFEAIGTADFTGTLRASGHSPVRAPRGLIAAVISVLLGCAGTGRPGETLRVTELTLFGDLDCFRVETPSAIYVYGKKGAGFASILDPDGRDWISYRHGGKAAGEYRGLPKCGQPTKYFHAGYGFGPYKTDNPFTSRVTVREPEHVQIRSESKDSAAACTWDFYPSHARFTLERMALPRFWFLYEGTPGGALDAEHGTAIRPGGRRTALVEPWEDDVPWVCFYSRGSPYGLLLASHDDGVRSASYVAWPYKPEPDGGFRQMTVFGWGRPGWKDAKQHEPQLGTLPGRFSVALVRGADEPTLVRMVGQMSRPR